MNLRVAPPALLGLGSLLAEVIREESAVKKLGREVHIQIAAGDESGVESLRVSERRGWGALRIDRSSHRYRSIRDDQAFLRYRIREIASSRIRHGYRRIYIALRREGIVVNHKRVRRLYRTAKKA